MPVEKNKNYYVSLNLSITPFYFVLRCFKLFLIWAFDLEPSDFFLDGLFTIGFVVKHVIFKGLNSAKK